MMTLSKYVEKQYMQNNLVVQSRMGFTDIKRMKKGLQCIKNLDVPTIGTITIDSFTRTGQYKEAKIALLNGSLLNGFPIIAHGAEKVSKLIEEICYENFVVQVRHGTALPYEIFKIMLESGITATEGGPISYCLPYSRVSIQKAVDNWQRSCKLLFEDEKIMESFHIESFAGCMLGQLCPPSMLIALVILEGIFFIKCKVKNISLSYAQGTSPVQDLAAVSALRKLADEYLFAVDWHIVFYTYMGVFPETYDGSIRLIKESAKIAKQSGCKRLIVKTTAESHRIPTVQENILALEEAFFSSNQMEDYAINFDHFEFNCIYDEAKNLIDTTLNIDKDLNQGLEIAFSKGILDIPYCLHKENLNLVRVYINEQGYLKWANFGNLPFSKTSRVVKLHKNNSDSLLYMLNYVKNNYDQMVNLL